MTLTAVRPFHHWTEDELLIIRRDYKHTLDSARRIAEYLSRQTGQVITTYGVKGQVAAMGISKSDDRHPWSPEQDEQLSELITQHCPRRVAKIMHRSLNSVVVRSKRIGISRRIRTGWYTKRDVCEILGHDHKWVQRRIDSGAIKATYHSEARPQQSGGSCWHINENDLVAFIRRYPEELVGVNIDIVAVVELLAGITNGH